MIRKQVGWARWEEPRRLGVREKQPNGAIAQVHSPFPCPQFSDLGPVFPSAGQYREVVPFEPDSIGGRNLPNRFNAEDAEDSRRHAWFLLRGPLRQPLRPLR